MFYQVLRHKRMTSGSGSILGDALARLCLELTRTSHQAVWCSKQANLCSLEGKSHHSSLLAWVQDRKRCTEGAHSPSACHLSGHCSSQMASHPLLSRKHIEPTGEEWIDQDVGLMQAFYSDITFSWASCCAFLLHKLLNQEKRRLRHQPFMSVNITSALKSFFIVVFG